MPSLQKLPATASTDKIIDIISRDGALILENVLDASELKQFRQELDPYMEATENAVSYTHLTLPTKA